MSIKYGQSELQTLAEKWTVSSPNRQANGTLLNYCGKEFFGGIGVIGGKDVMTRTYESLPDHETIHFSVIVKISQKWTVDDHFFIVFDESPDRTFGPYHPAQLDDQLFVPYCSKNPNLKEVEIHILLRFVHSLPTLKVQFVLHIESDLEASRLGFEFLLENFSFDFKPKYILTDNSDALISGCKKAFAHEYIYLGCQFHLAKRIKEKSNS